ncbi:MAG: histidine kinase [Propionibacteriaceae bacterium]|nr:histidine kinase [Propionibacteriaceae bacterium]
MLYAAEPVRDRAWWIRTAAYWFVLCTQAPGASGWLFGLLAVILPVIAVYFRDRYPWALAVLALALTATIAETPVAAGMVVVASRVKGPLVVGYALAGALGLLAPWDKQVSSGISATAPDPTRTTQLVLHLVLIIVLPWLIGLVRRTNREAGQDRLRFEAEQRELAAGQAVTEERNRIAQEMHDVLGHKLSLITVQAGALEVNPGAGETLVGQQAALIRTTARQALDELREILGVLGEPAGDQLHPALGLAAARELIEHNRASGMRIAVSDGLPEGLTLPTATAAAVHRIVQEGLTNALRHAPGAAVNLILDRPDPRTLRVEMVNRPPARRGAGPGSGRGLPGLRERVRSLGGRLCAEPTDDGGYRLTADLPLSPAHQEAGDV